MGLTRKININFSAKVTEPLRKGIPWLMYSGMQWGVAFTIGEMLPFRCIRWRRYGICRYILIGKDRGKIIPVMRNFRKIRDVTVSEEIKVKRWIERYKKYS